VIVTAAARMSGFTAHLRRHGFTVGPAETELVLSVLAAEEFPDVSTVRLGLKTLLSGNRDQWAHFDDLFDAFWFGRGLRAVAPAQAEAGVRNRSPRPEIWDKVLPREETASAMGRAEHSQGNGVGPNARGTGRLIASRNDALSRTDLRTLTTPEEAVEAERIAERLARAIRYRLSRRRTPARRGETIDIRRTIRRNLSRGGEPIELRRKHRPERPVKLVMLLDASGSMEVYSRYFISFVRGLIGRWLHADAFLFHTRLVHIADALRERHPGVAMARLSLMADGFGGGTRIATALKTFNDRYAKETLDRRTVVIVMSDGYDTDSPEALAVELRRLKRRAHRLVWLNPLLGWKNYEPVARAMSVALDYVDYFAPAHSLASLAALEGELARL
jgi:uncharacterized protein with von Willebrand factor type A (vWA) domain